MFPILAMLVLERRGVILNVIALAAAFFLWRAIGYSGSRTGVYVVMALAPLMFAVIYPRISQRARPILIGLGVFVVGAFII